MKNNAIKHDTMSNAPILIPIFAAVVLIITASVYIVFKLTQQMTAKKWAEYDDCGWS